MSAAAASPSRPALALALAGTLSPQEAASYLGYCTQTLAGWRFQGVGPRYLKLGHGKRGKIRYRLEDLDAYIASCVTDPVARADA
jgi:hypothetical protein